MYRYAIRETGDIAVVSRANIRVREGQHLVEHKKYYSPRTHIYDFKRSAFFEKTAEQQKEAAEKAAAAAQEATAAAEKARTNALRRLKTAVNGIEDAKAQKAIVELAALLGIQIETKRKKK